MASAILNMCITGRKQEGSVKIDTAWLAFYLFKRRTWLGEYKLGQNLLVTCEVITNLCIGKWFYVVIKLLNSLDKKDSL